MRVERAFIRSHYLVEHACTLILLRACNESDKVSEACVKEQIIKLKYFITLFLFKVVLRNNMLTEYISIFDTSTEVK